MNVQMSYEDVKKIFNVEILQDLSKVYGMTENSDFIYHDVSQSRYESEFKRLALSLSGSDPFFVLPNIGFSPNKMHLLYNVN